MLGFRDLEHDFRELNCSCRESRLLFYRYCNVYFIPSLPTVNSSSKYFKTNTRLGPLVIPWYLNRVNLTKKPLYIHKSGRPLPSIRFPISAGRRGTKSSNTFRLLVTHHVRTSRIHTPNHAYILHQFTQILKEKRPGNVLVLQKVRSY